MNWNDVYDSVKPERITEAGLYFCKITDAKIEFASNQAKILKVKFVTKTGIYHDESCFISAKALFKIKRMLSWLKLSKDELADIEIDVNFPENSADEILRFFQKYVVGKLVKIELEIDTYRTNERYTHHQIKQLRQLDPTKEQPEIKALEKINLQFPKPESVPGAEFPTGDDDLPF